MWGDSDSVGEGIVVSYLRIDGTNGLDYKARLSLILNFLHRSLEGSATAVCTMQRIQTQNFNNKVCKNKQNKEYVLTGSYFQMWNLASNKACVSQHLLVVVLVYAIMRVVARRMR
jgi:hypothetical protein